MFSGSRLSVSMLVVLLAGSVTHAADKGFVSVRHGTFAFDAAAGQLDIRGNQGFRLEAVAFSSGGRFEAFTQCQTPDCAPGTVVNLGAFWSGNDLPGTAELKGQTYGDVGGLDSPNHSEIAFSGSVTMPPMSAEPVLITVPFDFAGLFVYGDGAAESNRALLTGGGRVTLSLEPSEGFTSWAIRSAFFEFSPVEER